MLCLEAIFFNKQTLKIWHKDLYDRYIRNFIAFNSCITFERVYTTLNTPGNSSIIQSLNININLKCKLLIHCRE